MASKLSDMTKKTATNLKSKEFRNYLMSTHFWGPLANWGIAVAAMLDFAKDPKYISATMTSALIIYSLVFMCFALKVQPRNLLLFACHVVNAIMQTAQAIRLIVYTFNTKSAVLES